MDPYRLSASGRHISRAGALLERAAHASKPSTSAIGRISALIGMARLGVQIWPAARRALQRYPGASALVAGGLVAGWFLLREDRTRSDPARRY